MLRQTIFIFLAFAIFSCNATNVSLCDGDSQNVSVEISNCNEQPCKLKKRTVVEIREKFVPLKDVQHLKTSVYASVFGIKVPFVGVHGSNACDKIYNIDGSKASCPLKKNVQYEYVNSFGVSAYYPQISTRVYYSLLGNSNVITCFQVTAKIVN